MNTVTGAWVSGNEFTPVGQRVAFKSILEVFHLRNFSKVTSDEGIFLVYAYFHGDKAAKHLAGGHHWKCQRASRVLYRSLDRYGLRYINKYSPEQKISLDMLERLMHNSGMNRLSHEKRTQIIGCLVEGNSLRATARMCDVAFNTVLKLLPQIGNACADYQDRVLRNLRCKRIQCDEIWTFCYAKEKNVPPDKKGKFGFGDIWTWVAIDADTKLVPSFMVGNRDLQTARIFIDDLKSRLANRVQLTTDGLKVYLDAVEGAFGADVDYAMLVKLYESAQEETRYSPAECVSCERKAVMGKPDPKHISTSYVERQNLTMRMQIRRFTRLTNGFSKKVENHAYHVALHYMHYNFCRIHRTLRVTPAMEAGISNHVWSIGEIASL